MYFHGIVCGLTSLHLCRQTRQTVQCVCWCILQSLETCTAALLTMKMKMWYNIFMLQMKITFYYTLSLCVVYLVKLSRGGVNVVIVINQLSISQVYVHTCTIRSFVMCNNNTRIVMYFIISQH